MTDTCKIVPRKIVAVVIEGVIHEGFMLDSAWNEMVRYEDKQGRFIILHAGGADINYPFDGKIIQASESLLKPNTETAKVEP